MNLDGYNGTMDRRVYLKSVSDLEDVVGLVEQSYKNGSNPIP
jgi:predicted transport protein